MNKYIVEFIGTFFLVFVIGVAAVLGNAGAMAPLAIGAMLMVMIFAGGHISGGHYNPAVSLGAMLRGALPSKDLPFYIGAQVLGAVVAAILSIKVVGAGKAIEAVSPPVGTSLLVEFLFTFALVWTVLNVATAKGTENNSFYGLAIGFVVVVGAFTVGGISLGAFNPAVAIGLVVMGKLAAASVWVHLVANFAGGIVAAMAFNQLVRSSEPKAKSR